MNLLLTAKERTMLQDQLKHEAICIQKYKNYANQATDPQLQQLFSSLAAHEQKHYITIEQMLKGQIPNLQQTQGQQQGQNQGQQQNLQTQGLQQSQIGQPSQNASSLQGDAALCTDSIMTEKFVSGAYDTGVFESSNQPVIQALQHIQKEEQEHGQKLQQYLQSTGLK
jgi:rubrerythrin